MRTSKFLVLFIFVAVTAHLTNAQGFGVKAGANFSDINANFDADSRTGLYVGVFKEIPLIKSLLFIQPELQYSQEGFETKTTDVKIDYLALPIMAKVYVLKIVSFETGPQFSFPVSDNLDEVNAESFVTSWGLGMSINLPLHLSINARYVTGLTDAIELDDSNTGQVFQVGAGFRF